MELRFENAYFGGEAIPCTNVNWGAIAMAAFYGGKAVFKKSSVWYPEVINDWDEWKRGFDQGTNEYWRQTLAIVELLLERNGCRHFVGTPEFGTGADLLSLMRGMDKMAMDLMDRSEKIREAIGVLGDTRVDLHEKVYCMTRVANEGGGVLARMIL